MRALRVHSPGAVSVDRMEPRVARSGQVEVELEFMGVCGTDISIVSGSIPVAYPRVLGHELVGHVLGGDVGGRVLVDPSVACGRCSHCVDDRPHLCTRGGLIGRDYDGGFADRVVVPSDQIIAIPEGLPVRTAGLLQVLGTCVHAQRFVSVFPGQVGAVVGLGVSGLLMTQLLVSRGATVLGVTRSEWKRELAAAFGAAVVAEPSMARQAALEATDGRGVDFVIEAVGTIATLSSAVDLARPGATVVMFGTITQGARGEFPWYEMYRKEISLFCPRAARRRDYVSAIDLAVTGQVTSEGIWTKTFPLSRGAQAFEMNRQAGGVLKVGLVP